MSRWDESDQGPSRTPEGPSEVETTGTGRGDDAVPHAEAVVRGTGAPEARPSDPSDPSGRSGGSPARAATTRVLAVVAGAVVLTLALAAIIVGLPSGGTPAGGSPAPTGAGTAPSPTASGGPSIPASPGPSAAGPPGGPMPAGFAAVSVTFVSPDEGWALGAPPCASGPCTTIARTTDGGGTWVSIPAPAAPVSEGQGANGPGVAVLRFADPLDGWAAGPDLWSTHDGGASWTKVTIPGLGSGTQVFALETAAGLVHAVAYDGAGSFRIASSPVGSDDWSVAPVAVPVGAGPVPRIQLVLAGTAGWVVEVDRTVIGGARLDGGTWTTWTPPCADVLGPALLAASTQSELVAACDGGVWGPPKVPADAGEHLFVSHDGGGTFTRVDAAVPLTDPTAIAAPEHSVVVLGGPAGQSGSSAIATSADAGRTWTTSPLGAGASVAYLGFTTPTQGTAIVTADPSGSLLLSRDAGRTWTTVSFAGS